ncbi:MAG: right-handed parallel beta-helix repeat-containing protein [Acidobacteria bacterium]|nr:MAG: right-handed parallel beta-helix repeat-containing protein [Acidobacteriota bacterium]
MGGPLDSGDRTARTERVNRTRIESFRRALRLDRRRFLAGTAVTIAAAIAPVAGQTPVSGPAVLDQPGETYVVTADFTAPGTAFVIAADDITLDLNGHTVVFGDAPVVRVPNAGFEQGSGATPAEWDLSAAPGARRTARQWYWENWELHVDMTASSVQTLRSAPVTLPGDQTYIAFGWVRGTSSDSATLRVRRTSDGAVVAESSRTGINRGFALEARFKPAAATEVYVELELHGSSEMWCDEIDIKPAFQYGVASYDWQDPDLFPDLPPGQVKHGARLTIKNGVLRQGRAQAVRSAAVKSKGPDLTITGVTLETNSINSNTLDYYWGGGLTIENSTITATSLGVFNRMSPVALVNATRTKGDVVIRNSTIEGGAQQGIALYRRYAESGSGSRILIENNTIKNHEKVTNGYGIGMTGCRNFTIRNNVIAPVFGRGLLIDTAGTDGTNSDGEIYGNTISVKEKANHEFGPESLQVAGIRLRTYPPKGNFRIHIHDNEITAYTDESLVSQANGITATLRSSGEDVVIENNVIRSQVVGAGRTGQALLFEETLAVSNTVARNNVLEGNHTIVRFGDFDGKSTSGILLDGNTLRRGTPARADFRSVRIGYWNGTESGLELRDTSYESGADVDDMEFIGSGTKDVTVSWYLTVRVTDGSGAPLGGAQVTVTDASGGTTTGTTGSDGTWTTALPEYRRAGASGADRTEYNPYTVTVRYGSASSTQNVTLDRSQAVDFVFEDTGGNAPPSPVRNNRRGDVETP